MSTKLPTLSIVLLVGVTACFGDQQVTVTGVAPESHACLLVVTKEGRVISDLSVSGRFQESYAVRSPASDVIAALVCDGQEIAKGVPSGRNLMIDLGEPKAPM